jgi:hypothetical protein
MCRIEPAAKEVHFHVQRLPFDIQRTNNKPAQISPATALKA